MKNVLVVDDDRFTRLVIKQMLEIDDFNVFEAESCNECFRAIAEKQIDVIFMDIFMPGKSGLEAIMELKSSYPEIKIIAITGGGVDRTYEVLYQAKSLGAHYTIAKPFGRKEIMDSIAYVLHDVNVQG